MDRQAPAPLSGRSDELRWLARAWAGVRSGEPSISLVGGETGIGKTALADALAFDVRDAGGRVLTGRAPIGASDLPFAAIRSALRKEVTAPGNASVREVLDQYRPVLAGIFPELGEPGRDAPREGGRLWVYEAMSQLFAAVAADVGALLVLEDLHWADGSTLEFLAFLASGAVRAPMAVIGTYRTELPVDHFLRQLLAESGRDAQVRSLRLGALDTASADTLIRQWAPQMSSTDRAVVLERADGNPWFLQELVRAPTMRLPDSLTVAIEGQLNDLPAATLQLLRHAAVMGRLADTVVLAASLGLDVQTVAEGLLPAMAAGVVETVESEHGDLLFRHTATRELVYAQLPPGQRSQTHRAIAAAIEALPDRDSRVGSSGRRAYHWREGGEPDRAFGPLLESAKRAELAYAFREAAAALRQAAAIWDAVAPSVRLKVVLAEENTTSMAGLRAAQQRSGRSGLLRRAAEATSLAGEPDVALRLIEDAIAEWDNDAPARMLLGRRAFFIATALGAANAIDAYDQAVAAFDGAEPSAETCRILVDQARNLRDAGDTGLARERVEEALVQARACGTKSQEARALTLLGTLDAADGQTEVAVANLATAQEVMASNVLPAPIRMSRVGDVMTRELDRVRLLGAAGRTDDAVEAALQAAGEARRLGAEQTWGGEVASVAASELFELGRWDEADAALERALASAAPAPSVALGLLVRGRILAYRGSLNRAQKAALSALAIGEATGDPSLLTRATEVLTTISIFDHRPRQAADLVTHSLPSTPVVRAGEQGLTFIATAARALADAVHMPGGRRDASLQGGCELLLAEAEIAQGTASSEAVYTALRQMIEAEIARLQGTRGPDLWHDAVEAWSVAPRLHHQAYALMRFGEGLLATKQGRPQAREGLLAALDLAEGLGAGSISVEVKAIARRARLDLQPNREVAETQPTDARLGLSAREFEVLELLVEGLTNRQIADRLFITEKTAGHHVSSILSKLGVGSRLEAAALAHQSGAVASPPGPSTEATP